MSILIASHLGSSTDDQEDYRTVIGRKIARVHISPEDVTVVERLVSIKGTRYLEYWVDFKDDLDEATYIIYYSDGQRSK